MSGHRISDHTVLTKPGETVHLVRWQPGEDGWQSTMVTGLYLRHDGSQWQLVRGGIVEVYPRDQWQLCIA